MLRGVGREKVESRALHLPRLMNYEGSQVAAQQGIRQERESLSAI